MLLSEIQALPFYSIICDEATHSSKTEEMLFSVRFVIEMYGVSESSLESFPVMKEFLL